MSINTGIVHINSELNGREEALETADRFNKNNKFSGKTALHIRLLTEELICMVHNIFEGFLGNLWLESNRTDDGVICKICLSGNRVLDPKQEDQLISVSSTGRNEYAKGILGMIREAFRVNAQYSADKEYMKGFYAENNWYGMGIKKKAAVEDENGENCWSLSNYRDNLSDNRESSAEEIDELERSIIAQLADDVKVWITDETTEVVIVKRIKE